MDANKYEGIAVKKNDNPLIDLSIIFPSFNAQITPNRIDMRMIKTDETTVNFNVFINAGPINDHTGLPLMYESPKSNCKEAVSQSKYRKINGLSIPNSSLVCSNNSPVVCGTP
jgi:hypothetical protein